MDDNTILKHFEKQERQHDRLEDKLDRFIEETQKFREDMRTDMTEVKGDIKVIDTRLSHIEERQDKQCKRIESTDDKVTDIDTIIKNHESEFSLFRKMFYGITTLLITIGTIVIAVSELKGCN